MNECIDVFSRLLIATITFVVPIIINLLSTFSEGEKRRLELTKTIEEEISRQAALAVQSNPSRIRETIQQTSEEYKRVAKQTKKQLDLLNPIVQFWLIFSSLSVSLIFLLFAFIIRGNTWGLYNHNLSIFSLLACGITYLVGLFFIIRILYTIRNAKRNN